MFYVIYFKLVTANMVFEMGRIQDLFNFGQ
jgi:hypothetical protein